MKKSTLLIVTILFSVVSSAQCESTRSFGGKSICLPKVLGMTESYGDSYTKIFMDQFKGTPGEKIIGVYLLDDVYDSRHSTFYEDGAGDDYIKMFSLSDIEYLTAGKAELDMVFDAMTDIFKDMSGGDYYEKAANKLVDEGLFESVEIGAPTMIESYSLNSLSRSCVLLVKMNVEGEAFIQTQTLNVIILKNRMFMYAYYKLYEGPESIKEAKQNSDFFGYSLFSNN